MFGGRIMSSLLVHVGVRATDLEKTIRFWRDALGLTVVSTLEGCYDLSDGYHNFRIFQHDGPERPDHVSGLLDYLHIGVKVPNLKEAAQRCRDQGFEIIYEGLNKSVAYPEDLPEIEFKVEDPDGIVVDVTQNDDQWPGVNLEPRQA